MTDHINIEIVDYTNDFLGEVREVITTAGKTDAQVAAEIEEAKLAHGQHCDSRMVEEIPAVRDTRRGLFDMRRDLGRAPTAQEWADERR